MKKVLIVIIAVVSAFAIAVVVYWHELNIVPDISIPKPSTTPSPNAYDYFVSAYALDRDTWKWNNASFNRQPGYKPFFSDPHSQYYDPDDRYYSLPEQEALLRENLPMLAKVREGLAYSFYPAGVKPPDFFDRNNKDFREEGRLFSFAGKVHSEEGNWKEALRDELDCVALGTKVEYNGAVMSRWVGIAIDGIGRRRAWDAIDHLSSEDARAGALRLESIVDSQPPLENSFRIEKRQTEYELAKSFLMPGRDGTVAGLYENQYFPGHPAKKDVEKLRFTSKRSVIDHYGSYMDACANRANLSYGDTKLHPVALPADPYSKYIVSFVSTFLFEEAHNNAENDLLMTSLALRAYKADQGSYPASLSQLVPRYLHALPSDPFAVSGPIRYHTTSSSYVLYSVGPDGLDNNGKPIVNPGKARQLRSMVMRDSKGDIVAGVNF